tara:strand:- start:5996 stop:6322 length:327 start_codon:yes stop_codon:yes gene_type:complete
MVKTIYLAVREHKHGVDNSAHTTETGAKKQLAAWARETLDDWHIDGKQYSSLDVCGEEHPTFEDDALIEAWPELTGETEFLRVEMLHLHHDEPSEKENWTADTSHIGA